MLTAVSRRPGDSSLVPTGPTVMVPLSGPAVFKHFDEDRGLNKCISVGGGRDIFIGGGGQGGALPPLEF